MIQNTRIRKLNGADRRERLLRLVLDARSPADAEQCGTRNGDPRCEQARPPCRSLFRADGRVSRSQRPALRVHAGRAIRLCEKSGNTRNRVRRPQGPAGRCRYRHVSGCGGGDLRPQLHAVTDRLARAACQRSRMYRSAGGNGGGRSGRRCIWQIGIRCAYDPPKDPTGMGRVSRAACRDQAGGLRRRNRPCGRHRRFRSGGSAGSPRPGLVGPPGDTVQGGEIEARRRLDHFVDAVLDGYADARNEPSAAQTSFLSPYLHFGHISPVDMVLAARDADAGSSDDRGSFIEELVVRRELSMNYVAFEPKFDTYEALPDWARKTLEQHAGDEREYVYSAEELELQHPRCALERRHAGNGAYRVHA